jgi:capsular exopolysaccharide synthesis family protein
MAVQEMKGYNPYLVVLERPQSVMSEAFRSARTSLQFALRGQEVKTILVTSSVTEEGKTTAAVSLAITLAQSGSRVVLVDCDLRRPSLHKIFGLPGRMGVSHLLTQDLDPGEVAQTTELEGLKVIVAGPRLPNPAEMLGQDRMHRILERLEEQADLVVLDSSPVLAVTDPVVLAAKVDAVVLVARFGVTRNEALRETHKRLDQAGARILGVLINNMQAREGGYYAYYNYEYKPRE